MQDPSDKCDKENKKKETNDTDSSSACLRSDSSFSLTTTDPLQIFANLLAGLSPLPKFFEQNEQQRIQQEYQRETILKAADFLFHPSLLEASITVLDDHSSSIRYLRAKKSKRSIILVREYYCFIERDFRNNSCNGFYYCSCRSFYERLKRNRKDVCKHILAVIMAPYLGFGEEKCVEIKEEEYVKLVLEKTCDSMIR